MSALLAPVRMLCVQQYKVLYKTARSLPLEQVMLKSLASTRLEI